jgi:hypothetical protein
MRGRWMFTAAAMGLVLPTLSYAQSQDLAKPAPVAVSLPWQINCHGLAGVPITADAMQTLPLQVVGTLHCGERVAVLSDAEGYTLNVRTAGGKTGYVASNYVVNSPSAKSASHVEPTSAPTNNGVAHWRPGAKGCDQFNKNGLVVESLTTNGVTVQVSLQDTGSKLRANVAVGNSGALHVYVDPAGITLQSVGTHSKSLLNRDPAQLAKQTQRGGDMSSPASDAEFAPVFASANAVGRQPVEDLAKPKVASVPDAFIAEALKKGSLRPEGRTWGAVWFDRDQNPGQYVMRVPVDNQVFEFPLSLNSTLSLNR